MKFLKKKNAFFLILIFKNFQNNLFEIKNKKFKNIEFNKLINIILNF